MVISIRGKSKNMFGITARGITMKSSDLSFEERYELLEFFANFNANYPNTKAIDLWTSFAFEDGKINIFEVTPKNYASLDASIIFRNCIAGLDESLNVKADKIFLSADEIKEFKKKGIRKINLCTFSKGAPVSIAYNERGDLLFGTTIRSNILNGREYVELYNYLSGEGKVTYKMLFSNTYVYEDMGNKTIFEFLKSGFEPVNDFQVSFEMLLNNTRDDTIIITADKTEMATKYPFNFEGYTFYDARDKRNNIIQVSIDI